MPTDTPARRLAEHLLATPLDVWVTERRARGDSWRSIAQEIQDLTNGRVEIVGETLRGWFRTDADDGERVAS